MRNLFTANISPTFNFGSAEDRYNKFVDKSTEAYNMLIHNFLLYDTLVIPTQDFLCLRVLLNKLGEKNLLKLLGSGIIQFVRIQGSMGYRGSGGGIVSYRIDDKNKYPKAAFADIDKAVAVSLTNLDTSIDTLTIQKLTLNYTREIEMKQIIKEIKDETYKDVLNSNSIKKNFSLQEDDLNNLPGIKPEGFRIFGGITGDWKGDEIDQLMYLASTNLDIKLADEYECEDMATSRPIGHILKAKAERTFDNSSDIKSFTSLQEIVGIPDIAKAFYQGQIELDKLIKIRQSRNGELFRIWFHENANLDSKEILKEYVSLLQEIPKVNSFPVKILRFIIVSLAGPVAGAIDSFLIEKIFKGSSPKYFIEDLRQLSKPNNLSNIFFYFRTFISRGFKMNLKSILSKNPTGAGAAIGIGIGAAIGMGTNNVAPWIAIGLVFGAGIGAAIKSRH